MGSMSGAGRRFRFPTQSARQVKISAACIATARFAYINSKLLTDPKTMSSIYLAKIQRTAEADIISRAIIGFPPSLSSSTRLGD